MRKPATKVAVSMPADLYRVVEGIRKRSGKSRSAILHEALRWWLERQRQLRLTRQYVAGYRNEPETRREIEMAQAAAVQLLSSQEW